MVINHNIPALTTYGIVNNTSNALEKSIQKLSTGLRINSAADDAAGLSISEKMRAQIGGLDRAVANAQDGVSLIQTAEGALTETHSILQRMRELSVQAANDTLTQQDRSYIQEEIDLLREEVDHIGNTTTFNTKKLLNGDSAVLWSSDDLNTKAIVNGGLREVDQFGQKKSFEGNFKITVKANVGQAEVQKTDIFAVKHPQVGGKFTLTDDGRNFKVKNMTGENLRDDIKYTVSTTASGGAVATAKLTDKVTNAGALDSALTGSITSGSASLALEVTKLERDSNNAITSGTLHVYGVHTAEDGTVTEINQDIDLTKNGTTDLTGLAAALKVADFHADTDLTIGDKAVFNAAAAGGDTTLGVELNNGDGAGDIKHQANVNAAKNGSATIAFMNLNQKTGNITKESVTVDFGDSVTVAAKTLGTVENYKIGDAAGANVKLRDLAKFWDSQGNFMLDDPQKITITQGNGKQTSVTLYGKDTLQDVADKLNDAIANGLGQAKYIDDSAATTEQDKGVNHFV
ncbi:MAG: flagellin, partial [Synergistaceae bacterium]|nr:flagellin [Synergistaceae bacterium]